MNFEDKISKLNEFYFFREFTYSKNKFRKNNGQEVEVADNIICLDNIFIIFQIKKRNLVNKPTSTNEDSWFEKKVQKKATKQIRDTIQYLSDYDEVILNNERGDAFNIATDTITSVQKVVLYFATELLSNDKRRIKYHKSKTAGIIHMLSIESYEKVVKTLLTPAEVFEYLEFREHVIIQHLENTESVSEESLLGQYIIADFESIPDEKFSGVLSNLKSEIEAWDMTGIIHLFSKRITHTVSETDYYYILREIAKLMRHELKIFKERFKLSMESSKVNKFELPYRFAIPRLNLGFVLIPLCKDQRSIRKNGLTNFTLGHKYDQKLRKCIGATFLYEKDGWFSVEWCFTDGPWEANSEMEEMLKTNFPFLPYIADQIRSWFEGHLTRFPAGRRCFCSFGLPYKLERLNLPQSFIYISSNRRR